MYLGLFSFGGGEIFIVLIAVLVLFGANKIPELAKMLGKGMNEFRRATDDIKREFKEGADEFRKDLDDSKKDIDNHIHEITETVSETKHSRYRSIDDEKSEKKPLEDNKQEDGEIENLAQPHVHKKNSTTDKTDQN